MLYPQELIEEIRLQNDLVQVIGEYLPLKQKGSSFFGLCPFHHENTPSFSVSRDKQLYYCFGCGASGNVYSFIMEMEHCDFPEAVRTLADRAHIQLPEPAYSKESKELEAQKEAIYQIHKLAGRFYYEKLHQPEGAKALSYLEKRQIRPQIQRKFGLGYAPAGRRVLTDYLIEQGFSMPLLLKSGLTMENKDKSGYHDRFYNRLMFPIFDIQGRGIGFGGRVLDKGEPKYLNSPETLVFNKSKNLYGLNLAKETRKREIILVEGYMDMIAIYQAGYRNVAASLGTAFNQDHAKTLKRVADQVILLYDSDEAGTNAALRAIPVLLAEGFLVRVLQVPDGKDPDGFIREHGREAFGRLLIHAEHYISFQIQCVKKNYNLDNTEHKVRFTQSAAQILAQVESSIERDAYIKEVSQQSGITEDAIRLEVKKIRDKSEYDFMRKAEKQRIQSYSGGNHELTDGTAGILEAQRDILYLWATNSNIYQKTKPYLQTEVFAAGTYQKLAEIIAQARQSQASLEPAELVSHFSTPEEQKLVSSVFTARKEYNTKEELEKSVNEEIKLIKRAYLDKKGANAANIEDITSVIEEKKQLNQFHISIFS